MGRSADDPIPPQIERLLETAVAVQEANALEAGTLQFMARLLVQVTLPHSKPDSTEVERVNGTLSVSMMAPARIGLPYGSIPRLVLSWLSTEVVLKRSRDVYLGQSFTDFMDRVGLLEAGQRPSGGRHGSLARVKDQCRRLFATTVTCIEQDTTRTRDGRMTLADETDLWWTPIDVGCRPEFRGVIRLSEAFHSEVLRAPVPVDLRALRALKRSPLALDLYIWLTYRVYRLRRSVAIPWPSLQRQFGAGYPDTARGRVDFRQHFKRALAKVEIVYRAIQGKAIVLNTHLLLCPTRTHVPRVNGG